ncbi:class I SAM-dependent methyltransferase [Streptomyces aculeolatus]
MAARASRARRPAEAELHEGNRRRVGIGHAPRGLRRPPPPHLRRRPRPHRRAAHRLVPRLRRPPARRPPAARAGSRVRHRAVHAAARRGVRRPGHRRRAVGADARAGVAYAAHPQVSYVPGRAEALPLPDGAVDFALGFLVWHHVRDKPAGARELHRVLRPGGTLLLRTELTDSLPDLWYLDAFPRGREVLAALYEPLSALRATFEAAGWELAAVGEVTLPAPGTYAGALARLRTRAFSIFEHMPEADIEAGFAELARRVAADPQAPARVSPGTVVTFRRA